MRSVSRKQAKKNREYTAMRVVVLERDEHRCQLHRFLQGHHCAGTGLHVHHIRRRSQGGSNDPENLITLCGGPGSGHEWVHANPAEAALFGLLELRGGSLLGSTEPPNTRPETDADLLGCQERSEPAPASTGPARDPNRKGLR